MVSLSTNFIRPIFKDVHVKKSVILLLYANNAYRNEMAKTTTKTKNNEDEINKRGGS